MTRVNCVPPQELSRQHLIAEWREIHRIYGLAAAAVRKHKIGTNVWLNIPPRYTLGTGHCLFFYDKLRFIRFRQVALYEEMRRRNYKPGYKPPSSLDILAQVGHLELMNDWTPDDEAMALNRGRILERTNGI